MIKKQSLAWASILPLLLLLSLRIEVRADENIKDESFEGDSEPNENEKGVENFLTAIDHYYGIGTPQNYSEALKWFRLAAGEDFLGAQYWVGYMYENGEGTTKNQEEALRWYRLAADRGHSEAQRQLAQSYENGEGIEKDYLEAFRWYKASADQGNSLAQFRLGVFYYMGLGVTQNYSEASKWFLTASEDGHYPFAMFNLGVFYMKGQGVPVDFVQAHKWFNLALTVSYQIYPKETYEEAKVAREEIENKMTPEQIVQAQQLAKEWMEQYKR